VAITVLQLRKNKEVTLNRIYHYDKSAPISIQVDTLRLQKLNHKTSFTGTFLPDKETKITADIPGKITSVLVNEGDHVKKGQPLMQLDKSSMELQLKQVEVTIKGLKDDVKRFSILNKANAIQGVKLEKASLGLQSAELQKAILQDKINKTTIRAPYAGIITMKFREKGEYAAPGIPLFQLVDISTLKFNINVSENEVILFQKGKTYPVSPNVYPKDILQGEVTFVSAESNKMSHDFPVQFTMKNIPGLEVKAGMFGNVYIERGENKESIVISASSIVGSNIHPQVYLIKDGKAWLRDITISSRFQNNAVVSTGLKDGDIIVTTGFINLFDRANVLIKK
jgi:RND family efflux transporter MFP subunit